MWYHAWDWRERNSSPSSQLSATPRCRTSLQLMWRHTVYSPAMWDRLTGLHACANTEESWQACGGHGCVLTHRKGSQVLAEGLERPWVTSSLTWICLPRDRFTWIFALQRGSLCRKTGGRLGQSWWRPKMAGKYGRNRLRRAQPARWAQPFGLTGLFPHSEIWASLGIHDRQADFNLAPEDISPGLSKRQDQALQTNPWAGSWTLHAEGARALDGTVNEMAVAAAHVDWALKL